MARGRMLDKKLSTSRKFAAVGKAAGEFPQLLYALLVPHCDDFGRQPGDAFTVKHEVFPTSARTEDEFEAALVALEQVRLIERYVSAGIQVLQVVKFDEHQHGLHKRTRPDFPDPQPSLPGNSGISGNLPDLPAQVNVSEVNVSEPNRTEPCTYGDAGASRCSQTVENSEKASTWKRAIAISHAVIETDPKHPENWSHEVKTRMKEQHLDPHERSPRGSDTFNDALDYVIKVRSERHHEVGTTSHSRSV